MEELLANPYLKPIAVTLLIVTSASLRIGCDLSGVVRDAPGFPGGTR